MPQRPLPLSLIAAGASGQAIEDLRWYFTEADAAQSGLKSSMGAFTRRLEVGGSQQQSQHHYDFRRLEHIRRARGIEKRLKKCSSHTVWQLCYYFTSVLPQLQAMKAEGRRGKRAAEQLRTRYESTFASAVRAYISGKPESLV